MAASAAGAFRGRQGVERVGGREGGGPTRGGSVAARVVLRDPGLPGSAGGSPGGNTRTIL